MIRNWNEIDYERMAKKAVEKNIGYFMRKLSRSGEYETNHKQRYRGVSYRKENRNWRAYHTIGKRHIHIGVFKTEQEAVKAYENYMKGKMKIAA